MDEALHGSGVKTIITQLGKPKCGLTAAVVAREATIKSKGENHARGIMDATPDQKR
jgi:hypothetical protein